jgi:outer membrane protein OmpA-like peptidoglycan-associated protein
MVVRWNGSMHGKLVLALLTLGTLGGCSYVPDAVNPIVWYRDVSGASQNDELDKIEAELKELEAGSDMPYPNLAEVPNAPDTATSTIDREKLRQSLMADRANAIYSNEQLRAGAAVPGSIVVAPPPPAAPAAAAPSATGAAAPQQQAAAGPPDSPLVSPTIPSVPAGDTPNPPPPPPPKTPLAPTLASASPDAGPSDAAPPAAGRRRATPASSVEVAQIGFSGGSSALTDDERNRLSEIAAMQHQQGGALRIVGHADASAGKDAPQQQIQALTLALDRAKAVAQVLSSEGVAAAAIAVEAAPSRAEDSAPPRAEVFLEH